MSAQIHITDPGHWAELQGMCAGARLLPLSDNPYTRGSALWRRWKDARAVGLRGVSREAKQRENPGRGRAKLGPRREWLAVEDCALLTYWGSEPAEQTAARLPGRNNQACRNRMHRLRKAAARRREKGRWP